jgi:hypothetical protein
MPMLNARKELLSAINCRSHPRHSTLWTALRAVTTANSRCSLTYTFKTVIFICSVLCRLLMFSEVGIVM